MLLVSGLAAELSAGSEIFDLNWAHYQKSIKPALTNHHLPKLTLEPKAT